MSDVLLIITYFLHTLPDYLLYVWWSEAVGTLFLTDVDRNK